MFEYYTIGRIPDHQLDHRARSRRAAREYEFERALHELDERRRAERRAERKHRRTRLLRRPALKWLA